MRINGSIAFSGLILLLSFASNGVAAEPAGGSPGSASNSRIEAGPSDIGNLVSPANKLGDPRGDPEWRELLAKLAPHKTRQSTFEERRFFPFRRAPIVLQGEIRIVPELGLSLRYLEPEPRIMIVDSEGMLMRDAAGRERAPPADNRAQAATAALVDVLRFDFEKLKRDFEVYGRRDGRRWEMAFVPRDPAFASLLGVLAVSGEGNALRKIEMVKSSTQRIEITIKDTVEDLLFTADTLRRFFR